MPIPPRTPDRYVIARGRPRYLIGDPSLTCISFRCSLYRGAASKDQRMISIDSTSRMMAVLQEAKPAKGPWMVWREIRQAPRLKPKVLSAQSRGSSWCGIQATVRNGSATQQPCSSSSPPPPFDCISLRCSAFVSRSSRCIPPLRLPRFLGDSAPVSSPLFSPSPSPTISGWSR